MIKFLVIFLFIFEANAKDNCEIYNIFDEPVKSNLCQKGQRLFGYHQFDSENSQFKYEFNKKFNVHLLKLYKSETLNFLEKFCMNDDNLKIKEIINFNKNRNSKFTTKVIISCKLK